MTTSIIPNLHNHSTIPQQHQNYHSQYCTLQWRRGQLLVKLPGNLKQPYLPSLDNKQLLVECLKHSPVTLVSIDPKLGDTSLRFWADACKQAKKPIFLSTVSGKKLPKQGKQILRNILRLIDWILALFVLLLVSPVMLVLALLMQMYSPGLLFAYEWHIGEKGKLFQVIKFCTTGKQNITFLGFLMRKYGLDNLPKLFNVLRGDMSFIGSNCWALADAVQLSIEDEEQQNQLSVITNLW
ncbi:heterocyst development glycosyltransferase HepC [Trichormus variabilis]|uniref:heterocyst development glycosyltransferase HepC n=1 Tax=Anabaena variabilis TaxID=264691 RepID=UPI000F8D0D80|nr:heterocyst development glycosyltransferase HepC [Trichormus variabilis]MBD2625392.1 sugar transferase [Trichormus variabilis FACHB-164]